MQAIRRITEEFPKREIPPFPCPKCGLHLVAREKEPQLDQSSESEFRCDNEGDPSMYEGVFTLRLVCSSSDCEESVNCAGSFSTSQIEGKYGEPAYRTYLAVKFFTPTVHLFPLSSAIPAKVKGPLVDSFSTFWANPSAAGNSLRISVEALMDYRCVKKWYRDKKGRERAHDLHARIEMFRPSAPHLGDKILAVKWLGNSGSHLAGLKREDVIKAYEMYSYVLEELFDKRMETLTKMARKINRRRGPA
ncbi:MAG: DUF4145 domain-containing protein [Verrucomicrobia subdivision 3 bacterium]|nr:DUF4145 domain-containing protein [Limisphaerales bacterium]